MIPGGGGGGMIFLCHETFLGTDHLIFGGGVAGILLKKIVCFPTGVKKMKCLNKVKNKRFVLHSVNFSKPFSLGAIKVCGEINNCQRLELIQVRH